uniref:Polymerase delta interacting protein 3 n=1 Tax=Bombyx mori TaxID=7091 RepID=Q0ZAL5_BOMMO|nr:polymerase delta interacting protein 3 [Bombyx mori]
MSSLIEMSLEEIIKKKKINIRSKRQNKHGKQGVQQGALKAKPQVMDARNKIISKKRIQITDARDKLAELAKQRDARLKLEHLKMQRRGQMTPVNVFPKATKFTRTVVNKDRVFTDTSRQVVSQPLNTPNLRRQINNKRRFVGNKAVGTQKIHKNPQPQKILRTVENDIEIIDDDDDDPMGEEYIPTKLLNRKASLQLKIITHNKGARDKPPSTTNRTAISEREYSPPRPPSILKKRPRAALKSNNKAYNSDKTAPEFRIMVSSWKSTVTAGDIEELLGDVGGMVESRWVRPGTAEVIYKTQEDAQRAVDLYHNRQLDGQPMNGLLVVPRTLNSSSRNNSKPALYSTNSNVEPDLSTFHKVLFSNL